VIHRDIKPANILTHGNHSLVTDFGVAKALSAAMPDSTLTGGGVAIGTPAYMAPEQLAGDPDADSRADIYAAGLLAYELLTGRAAFSGASPRETMAAQLTSQPRRIEELRADVPPALAALIGRCLAKDPAQRPESAGAVLAELDRAVSDMSGSIAIPAHSARAGRIRRSARAFGAFAAVLLLVVFAYRAGRERRAATRQRAAVTPQQDSFSGMARGSAAASADTFTMAELRALIEQAVNARLEGKGAGAVAPSAGAGAAAAVSASAVSGSDSVRFRVYEESLRTFLRDSLIAAARGGAVRFAPRPIVVTPPLVGERAPERAVALALTDSLRRTIDRRRQYRIIPAESVGTVGPLRGGRMAPIRDSIQPGELVVTVTVRRPAGNDSASFRVMILDPIASRNAVLRSVQGPTVQAAALASTFDVVMSRTLDSLDALPRIGARGQRGPIMPLPPRNR
jgi:hypothetical protein